MTILELEKELKLNILEGIYILYGEETFLLESSLKKMKKIFGEQILGINYIQIDETNIEDFITNIQTPAFGYEKKLIIVKKSGLLKKEGKKVNNKQKELQNKVLEYLNDNIEEIIKDNIIIFIEEEIEKNNIYKLIEQHGKVCYFEKLTLQQIISRLKAIYSAYNVKIDEITLKYLVETSGTGMQELVNESRKLIEYIGKDGEVKKEHIDLLCIKQVEAVIFTLTDALGRKNIKTALETYNNLIYNKEPVQKILITLYSHFKKLYLTKIAVENGENIAEVLNLKPNQLFLTKKYREQASYFENDELRNILDELIVLDKNSKIGLIDINLGLEAILAKS